MIHVVETHSQLNELFQTFKRQSRLNVPGSCEEPDGTIKVSPSIFFVGLDCEYISKSSFPELFTSMPKWIKEVDDVAVCTIQLSNNDSCLILNMCKLGPEMPQCIRDILESNSWIKTGVGIDMDIKYISKNYKLDQCSGHIDLRTFGVLANINNPSLKELYEGLGFGVLSKNILDSKSTKWCDDLTMTQIKYAAEDAIASYKIGQMIFCNIGTFLKQKMNLPSHKVILPEERNLITLSTTEENYVGLLQEYAQKNNYGFPIYDDWAVKDGPYNTKIHGCTCIFNTKDSEMKSHGNGSTKKEAKTMAAKSILDQINKI